MVVQIGFLVDVAGFVPPVDKDLVPDADALCGIFC